MKPPTDGPRIGPSSAGIVIQLIAWTSSDFGTLLMTMMRPTGVIIAPPTPCNVRHTTSSASVCDKPQNSELIEKITIAIMKTRLPPNLSESHPLTGTNTARARR